MSAAPQLRSSQSRPGLDAAIVALLIVCSLRLSAPTLGSFFSFDDLHNLHFYLSHPREAVLANLTVITSFRRPLGALLYLPLYDLFGMDPFPYYLTLLLLYCLNIALAWSLAARVTGSRWAGAIAAAIAAYHPVVHNVVFNFGAIYELLSFTFIASAIHAYMNCIRSAPHRRIWYWLTIALFALGLDAKETVVVLPAVLLLHELGTALAGGVIRGGLRGLALRLGPLFAIAVAYTLAKTMGEGAMWRTSPAYQYRLDFGFYSNLAYYLSSLTTGMLPASQGVLSAVLALGAGLAIVLRSYPMLFGGGFALLTLLPILPMPRVWDLYLYLPLFGVGVYLAALASALREIAGRHLRILRPGLGGLGDAWRFAVLALLLGGIVQWSHPRFEAGGDYYLRWSAPWKEFALQLWRRYPAMPRNAVLGFESPPFDPDTWERYGLHLLVWLRYDNLGLGVFRLPEQRDEFLEAADRASVVHLFRYEDGVLVEGSIDD